MLLVKSPRTICTKLPDEFKGMACKIKAHMIHERPYYCWVRIGCEVGKSWSMDAILPHSTLSRLVWKPQTEKQSLNFYFAKYIVISTIVIDYRCCYALLRQSFTAISLLSSVYCRIKKYGWKRANVQEQGRWTTTIQFPFHSRPSDIKDN